MSSVGSEKGLFIAGILSAFISGIFAIQFLLKYLSKHTLKLFAYYRVALGILILAIAFIR